jgi:hypothetical protein
MRAQALLVAACLSAVLLAGCGDGPDAAPSAGSGTTAPIASGKGAISGLVINDVFRPVPGGVVLIQELGLTATSDSSGQFVFTDLEPGAYLLRVQADGHEAAPQTVDVREGEYAEVEVVARRVMNEGGRIITTEFSVFIPCGVDFVASGYVLDCTMDQSGDSFRAGFTSNYTEYANATYLVTEMKAQNPDRYEVQVREDDGTSSGGERYSVAQFEGDYLKIVHQLGVVDTVYNGQGNNVAWNNTKPVYTILFPDSIGREEQQTIPWPEDPTGQAPFYPPCCGAGVHFGIKAKFVQSLFIGEPEVDIASYGVLG